MSWLGIENKVVIVTGGASGIGRHVVTTLKDAGATPVIVDVSVNPINGEIKAGQYLQVDDKEYRITAVGYEAPVTLKGLGHCTINFSGATEVELPGTIYVEHKSMPILGVGTVIRIVEK